MSTRVRKIKVLMAKTSLDGHLRGVTVVSTALRDGGMEVVYGGMQNAAEIAQTALQEDVDVIGLNIGGRYGQVRELMRILNDRGMDDVLVIAGGTIPRADIPALKEMGVAECFPPGSKLSDIVKYIQENIRRQR